MKKGEIAKKIILAVATAEEAGGLALTLANIPGLGASIQPFIKWYKNQDKYGRYRIRKTFTKLRRQGLIEMKENENGKTKILLTDTGRKKTFQYQFENLTIEPQKKWDKKWRLIIFNIPRDRQKIRYIFRTKLKKLGFYKLQNNAWLYPYECRQEINFIAEFLNIKSYITTAEVNHFDAENTVKQNFNL
ncbi:MAG: hypothetical protein AAB772_03265 [Patescibacteria group bacterium]